VRRLAALLLAVSLHAGAAPFAVTVGGERLVLDTIPGLSDALPLGSPRVLELAESLTSASNRILLFALTDADIRRFSVAERPDLKRYMLLTTPNHLANERVTPAMFKLLIDDAQRDVGKPTAPADVVAFLDARPRGQATALEELKRGDTLYSLMLGARLPGEGGFFEKPQYLVSTSTFLLVRNKALQLQVYAQFEGAPDLDWLKFVTTRWIETLQRLNSR